MHHYLCSNLLKFRFSTSGSQTHHSESSVFSVEQLAVETHDNTVLLPGCGSSLMEDLTGNEMELGKYCNLWTDTVNTTWEECFLSVRPTETQEDRETQRNTEKHNILFTSLIFRKMDIVRLREKNSKYRAHLKIYMFFKVDKIRVAVSGVSPAAGNSLRRDTWTIPWSYRLLYRFILFNVGQLLPVTWNQSESVVGGTPSGHRRHCIKAFLTTY